MPHRFYCPPLAESGSVTLADAEAHHLTHVLRHQPGDVVELFRGDGLVSTCRITSLLKREVTLEVVAARRDPGPKTILTIATAVPKGDRFEWLVEKATELGVSRLIPLTTSRSVVDPRDGKLDKLRQTVVTACKQSGRNHLMAISAVTSWDDFVGQIHPDLDVLVAHPSGEPLDCLRRSEWAELLEQTRPMAIAIGPEGGFCDKEVAAATAMGAKLIRLGPSLLRIETAAIALAAKLLL